MTTLQPKGFFSYTRQDDEAQGKILSKLRELIQSELQLQYGRGKIDIFQDTRVIKPGVDFPIKTTAAMNEVVFFIPILTPNFVQSEWCCREVSMFLEREREIFKNHPELPREQRLLWPIHLIDISKTKPFDPGVIALLADIQSTDFRSLRFDIKAETRDVHAQIENLATAIRDVLNIEVTSPPTPEELIACVKEEQRLARLAKAQATREAKAAKALADKIAGEELKAREKEKADRLIEEQRKADELVVAQSKAEAERLAKEKLDAEERERVRLATIAQIEEEQRIADEIARKAREKEERRMQFWTRVRAAAKRLWMLPVGAAALVATIPVLRSFSNDEPAEVVTQADNGITGREINAPLPLPAKEASDWLVGDWAINQAETGCSHILKISLIDDSNLQTSINGKTDQLTWTTLDDGRIEAQNKSVKYVFRLQRDGIMVDDGVESEFSLSKCNKLWASY
jgi:TIR domain